MPRVSDLVAIGFSPIEAKHLGVISNGVEGNFNALTATGNNSQANAYQIIANYNVFTTVTSTNNSARLPLALSDSNGFYVVQNADSADSINLFPNTGDNFLGLSANTRIVIPAGHTANVYKQSDTSWLVQIVYSNAQNNSIAWSNYTPTYGASGSMTFTSSGGGISLARWARIGNIVFLSFYIEGTTGGTASNRITITLPVNSANDNLQVVNLGIRDASSGTSVNSRGVLRTAILDIYKPDTTNWTLGTGRLAFGNVFYEVA